MAKKKTKKELTIHSTEVKVLVGLLILVAGIATIIAPYSEGEIFDRIGNIVGVSSIFWGGLISLIGIRLLFKNKYLKSWKTSLGLTLFSIVASTFLTFWVPIELLNENADFSKEGGLIGFYIHTRINSVLGDFIEFLILIIIGLIAFSFMTGVSLDQMRNFTEAVIDRLGGGLKKAKEAGSNSLKSIDIIGGAATQSPTGKQFVDAQDTEQEDMFEPEISKASDHITDNKGSMSSKLASDITTTSPASEPFVGEDSIETIDTNARKKEEVDPFAEPQFPNWQFPPLSILQDPVRKPQDEKIHKRNAVVIEKTLRSFGVETKISKITIGPTVVQYALSITVGTKVAKIRNLSNDIALALATPESQVRIEAPIPGTSLIGIEIPNPTPNFVYIKEMVDELRRSEKKFKLPVVLGKNVAGEPIIRELASLPHLLVAGATGSGKSAGINSILTGLLMTKSPDELKLILVDPKMVEMAPYNGIPYLLTPVITDMELVVNALQWAIEEMLRRYRLLKQIGVRNIVEYNKKIGYNGMPYIVIIVDEMADLMLSTGVDVETKIVRLTQMARAVGIHMILATQRPSVDVITGLIKANVPGRAAFAVSTSVDSRVIIDQPGAETLIGMGDMMFRSPESGRPLRVQGAYTDTSDTENLITFIRTQLKDGDVQYSDDVTAPREEPGKANSAAAGNDGLSDDDLFKDAVNIVINAQKASASMLQRKLRIGYNRAARLIDELYEAKVIGPQEGSSPRRVMMTNPDQLFGSSQAQQIEDKEELNEDF